MLTLAIGAAVAAVDVHGVQVVRLVDAVRLLIGAPDHEVVPLHVALLLVVGLHIDRLILVVVQVDVVRVLVVLECLQTGRGPLLQQELTQVAVRNEVVGVLEAKRISLLVRGRLRANVVTVSILLVLRRAPGVVAFARALGIDGGGCLIIVVLALLRDAVFAGCADHACEV